MADESDDDGLMETLRARANDALQSVAGALRRQMTEVDAKLQELAPALATPENVERFQSTMETLSQLVYGVGFSVDPDAQRLFEFMDWAERHYGRQLVLEGLERYNPLFRQTFADVLLAARGAAVAGGASGADFRESVEAYRESATVDVLRFLAHLASREADGTPPGRDPDALASYLRRSGVPERFHSLADRARGLDSDARRSVRAPRDAAEPDPDESIGDQVRALIRGSVGFDRHLQFLSIGFLFASQGFLTRTALESLPEIVERSNLDDPDDVVDI